MLETQINLLPSALAGSELPQQKGVSEELHSVADIHHHDTMTQKHRLNSCMFAHVFEARTDSPVCVCVQCVCVCVCVCVRACVRACVCVSGVLT